MQRSEFEYTAIAVCNEFISRSAIILLKVFSDITIMTTVDNTQLPTFNSVEEMAAWAAHVLQELYPTEKITEDIERKPELVAQIFAQDLQVPQDDTWTYAIEPRMIIRLSLPLATDWKKGKLWQKVSTLGTSATPTDYYTV